MTATGGHCQAMPDDLLSPSDRICAISTCASDTSRLCHQTTMRQAPGKRTSCANSAHDGRDAAAHDVIVGSPHSPQSRRHTESVVVPAPRSHFEEFFGWQTMQPSQPPSTPRTCCLGHSLFEAKSPYDTRPSTKLEEVLDMLTNCEKGARRWSTGSFPTATHQAQGFKRPASIPSHPTQPLWRSSGTLTLQR
jgi:hypothetical protein